MTKELLEHMLTDEQRQSLCVNPARCIKRNDSSDLEHVRIDLMVESAIVAGVRYGHEAGNAFPGVERPAHPALPLHLSF